MTVLHSAMCFIEESLPSYYESKEKTNPLKEAANYTPQFQSHASERDSGVLALAIARNQGSVVLVGEPKEQS